jgi:hypothetical protein
MAAVGAQPQAVGITRGVSTACGLAQNSSTIEGIAFHGAWGVGPVARFITSIASPAEIILASQRSKASERAGPPHRDGDTSGSRRVSNDVPAFKDGDGRGRRSNGIDVWLAALDTRASPRRSATDSLVGHGRAQAIRTPLAPIRSGSQAHLSRAGSPDSR